MTQSDSDLAESLFSQAQIAFERGRYQETIQTLNQALDLVTADTPLDGQLKTWLVTAYEAAGEHHQALTLCRALQQHSQRETRKQSRRLLGILSAPQLRRHPEWLSQIPDLSQVTAKGEKNYTPFPRPIPSPQPRLLDLSERESNQVADLGFIWFGLGILVLGVGAWAIWG